MMDGDRTVVVNAVLCYLSNHRKIVSDQYLCSVIPQYFSDAQIVDSFELLRQHSASLLPVVETDDDTDVMPINVESILRIFHLCDLYRITLPQFAVTDLSSLPPSPPMPSKENDRMDVSTINTETLADQLDTSPSSTNGLRTSKPSNDAVFMQQMLLKIFREVNQVKSLVMNVAQARTVDAVNIGVNCSPIGDEEYDRGEEEEETMRRRNDENEEEDKEPNAVYDHTDGTNTPVLEENTFGVEEQKSRSRDSATSVARTTTSTPPKKRGSSRSSSSIEDAVAKLKAQRSAGGNDASPRPKSEPAESETPSPSSGVDDTTCRAMQLHQCGDESNGKNDNSLFPTTTIGQFADTRRMQELLIQHRVLADAASAAFMGIHPLAAFPFAAAAGRSFEPYPALAPSDQQHRFAVPSVTPTMSPDADPEQSREDYDVTTGPEDQPELRMKRKGTGKSKKTAKRKKMTDSGDDEALQLEKNDSDYSPNKDGNASDNGNAGDKPYVCTHTNCNKRFANKFLLKKHEFIHTGLRPYQCPYCYQKCNRKDNLLRHKLTHEKNYSKPRRRSCRVFGVKGSHSDVAADLSPSTTDSAKCNNVPQRPVSCTSSDGTNPTSTNGPPTDFDQMPPTPGLLQQSPRPAPPGLSLALLRTFMTGSLFHGAAIGGAVHSVNN